MSVLHTKLSFILSGENSGYGDVCGSRQLTFLEQTQYLNSKPCVTIYLQLKISSAPKSDPHNMQRKWNCVGCLHILWNTCHRYFDA
jgi:hypothetical protein